MAFGRDVVDDELLIDGLVVQPQEPSRKVSASAAVAELSSWEQKPPVVAEDAGTEVDDPSERTRM